MQQNSMKKLFLLLLSFSLLWIFPVSADGLKNSLNRLMDTKDQRSIVNLGQINLKGKTKSLSRTIKKRSSNTIIATVDGYKIRKREADAYLKKATKGKIKDYDRLAKKQQSMVINDLVHLNKLKNFKSRMPDAVVATVNGVEVLKKDVDAYLKQITSGKAKDFDKLGKKQQLLLVKDIARSIVINSDIDANVSEEEKDAIFKQIWVEKQMAEVTVTNDEMLAFYEETKRKALAQNPQSVVPSYMSLGTKIKRQVLEQKIMYRLMKDVKIEIYEDTNASSLLSDTEHVKKEL
jgi:hypothetical protein